MEQLVPPTIAARQGQNWVRLRTLTLTRWVAIAGQVAAIVIAIRYFRLDLNLSLISLAIGASAVTNLVASFIYPENKRLSEGQVTAMLIFDLCQLAALLALTGGLHNPFALLILAPVTISATALGLRSTIVVGMTAIALVSLVAVFYIPLTSASGFTIYMPTIFVQGFAVAIVIGILFLGLYAQRVSSEIWSMGEALLATQMALAREQKLTDLAGVVAATAHELGTPLATIKLASSELVSDLAEQPELREDARLIGEQADRCRDILRSMGRAGKEDKHLALIPFRALVEEAAEPHASRGKSLIITPVAEDASPEPFVGHQPEILHGIRNLIQNAVDFAQSTVWIDLDWTDAAILIRIIDDGPGFSPHVIGRLGDPFMSRRKPSARKRRPGYEGMGLGLFISKTLLERSGAEIAFANSGEFQRSVGQKGERVGAIVEVRWPRDRLEREPEQTRKALGENEKIIQ